MPTIYIDAKCSENAHLAGVPGLLAACTTGAYPGAHAHIRSRDQRRDVHVHSFSRDCASHSASGGVCFVERKCHVGTRVHASTLVTWVLGDLNLNWRENLNGMDHSKAFGWQEIHLVRI